MKQKYNRIMSRVALVAVVGVLVFSSIGQVNAASLTSLSDTMSRLKASTLSNHDIRFVTPTGVDASSDTITVTFSGGFTMGSFAVANVDLAVSASGACTTFGTEKTLAASASSGTWGVAQSGQVITLTAPTDATTGEITAGRCVQIEIGSNATAGGAGTTQITNGATGSSDTIAIAGVFGDTGTAAVDIITDDQVVVTATVDPTITFTINDNAIGFGSLSATAARWANGAATGSSSDTSAHNLTVATNAASGYVLTYNGATLTSGSNTIDVASITDDADGTIGTEQFAIGFDVSNSSTIATGYDHNATPGNRDWTFVAGTTTTVVSRTTPTNTETINAYYLANIAGNTEAGSYSTTITYIATGTF